MTFALEDEPRPIAIAVSGTNTYVAYFTGIGAAATTGLHGIPPYASPSRGTTGRRG